MKKSVPQKLKKPPSGDPAAVVLTGGSSGIGKAFLELILRLSPKTTLCNLSRRDFLPPPALQNSSRIANFNCDLVDNQQLGDSVNNLLKFIEKNVEGGPLWLVNNSGFGSYGPFAEQDVERQRRMIDLNVGALVQVTGLLLPVLRERGGMVVNIASTAAFQPVPQMATYAATKSFVLQWSVALREELRGTGVGCLCVCPGPTRTSFFREAGFQERPEIPGPSMSAAAVAEQMLRAIRRQQSILVPGWSNRLLIAVGAWLPKPVQARIAGAIMKRLRLEAFQKPNL